MALSNLRHGMLKKVTVHWMCKTGSKISCAGFMKNVTRVASNILLVISMLMQYSCRVIEKSSQHGFESGYYKHDSGQGDQEKVYLDITEDQVTVYPVVSTGIGEPQLTLPLQQADSLYSTSSRFSKTSLDIDITSILFKYRPSTDELPAQLSTDLNVALYAGWRHDNFRITGKKDPVGKNHYKVFNRGYDVGILAGTGSTFIGPSTTKTTITEEYNGMIIELGVAAFMETSFASFGIATGFDHLLSNDRDIWIYTKKPWIGFVVGIALN
jgi:hypothetical protein